MTHLIVHIGYPKTATTMLQINIFQNLHLKGYINYIGNSEGFNSKGIKQVDHFIRPLILGNSDTISLFDFSNRFPLLRPLLRDDIPNVLSFEYLTIPGLCDIQAEDTARKIKLSFGAKDVDFSVVITLRNHVDLLNSFYAHFLEWSYSHGKITEIDLTSSSADEWVEQHVLPLDSYIHKGFSFDYIGKVWSEEFGPQNIIFHLYEDLTKNENQYFNDWLSILNISGRVAFDGILTQGKFRVRPRIEQSYEISVPRFGAYARKAKFHEPTGSFFEKLSCNLAKIASNRLPKVKRKISSISPDNMEKILHVYGASNKTLFERNGLCVKKGKTYKYWT